MDTKIIGYGLLVAGIIAILVSGFNVYQVFTGKAEPIQIFNFDGIDISLSGLMGPEQPNVDAPNIELLPAQVLNQTSNLLAHLFLMGFIVNLSSKISMMGVYLVRPIQVRLKNGNTTQKV